MADVLGKILHKIFGSSSGRYVKHASQFVERINSLESEFEKFTDDELRAKTDEFRVKIDEKKKEVFAGKSLEALLRELQEVPEERRKSLKKRIIIGLNECSSVVIEEAFAVVREVCKRHLAGHRHFDVQLIGGRVLHEGKIAEMATGEGKTLVATLPAYINALLGLRVHIVSVNDYLVKRDRDWMAPIYESLGLTVGAIQSAMDSAGEDRKQQYQCDITYGTNNELGFDYLRDNMKIHHQDQVQGSLHYSIIDEVDSILIDEARTPLIISGPARDDISRYRTSDRVAKALITKQKSAIRETQSRIQNLEPLKKRATDAGLSESKVEDAAKKFKQDPSWVNEEEAAALAHKQYYIVERDRKSVHMLHDGVTAAQEEANVGSFYVGANMEWPHLIENALRAHVVYERDRDYVVQNNEIVIVDEFTGRLMQGRQWSEGLHQSIEAKENVTIKEETQTLATITLQNFFKLYCKLSGMTGTAMTELDEFMKIYALDVVAVPTNRPVNRVDHNDRIYRTVKEKYDAIVEEVRAISIQGFPDDPELLAKMLRGLGEVYSGNDVTGRIEQVLKNGESLEEMRGLIIELTSDLPRGRPVLVGTISIDNSEKLSKLLTRKYGLDHEVLNAKHHQREAEIVAKAGHRHGAKHGGKSPEGNVTIATNMAGRGTDIKLEDGVVFPKCIGDLAPREPGVIATKCCIKCPEYDGKCSHCFKPKLDPRFPELGRKFCPISPPCGLHIVGTERHESRRIDNQLRGRSGRQGDPGSSRFFLSLEDDLLRFFAGDWVMKMLDWLGMEEGMAIENKRISNGIERAQKKVEERNFAIRKNLLEYDEVMDYQRQVFYRERQRILEGRDLEGMIWNMIEESIDDAIEEFFDPLYPAKYIAEWVRSNLSVNLNPNRIDTEEFDVLEDQIKKLAKDNARDSIQMTIGEYLFTEEGEECDYRGLAKWAMSRFNVSLSITHMQKSEPEDIEEELIQSAHEKIDSFDYSPLKLFLEEQFARSNLAEWAKNKFDIDIGLDDLLDKEPDGVREYIREKVQLKYRRREIEYPVDFIMHQTLLSTQQESAFAASALVEWVNAKYKADWSLENLDGKDIKQIQREILNLSQNYLSDGKLDEEITAVIESHADKGELLDWCNKRFYCDISSDDIGETNLKEVIREKAMNFFRRELTMLEQFVLLNIYDSGWKEHLLTMDHLKQGIGLRGYAEKDPKIEYKKEGTRMFHIMLESVRRQVTDMIMKVEVTGPGQGRSVWQGQQTHHDEQSTFSDADREAAMSQQGEERAAVKTIRREDKKVRPNDQCPCGSGKKYKKCCGKKT